MSSDERLARRLFSSVCKEEIFSATEPVTEKSSNWHVLPTFSLEGGNRPSSQKVVFLP